MSLPGLYWGLFCLMSFLSHPKFSFSCSYREPFSPALLSITLLFLLCVIFWSSSFSPFRSAISTLFSLFLMDTQPLFQHFFFPFYSTCSVNSRCPGLLSSAPFMSWSGLCRVPSAMLRHVFCIVKNWGPLTHLENLQKFLSISFSSSSS